MWAMAIKVRSGSRRTSRPLKFGALAANYLPRSIDRTIKLGAPGVVGKRAPAGFLTDTVVSDGHGVRWCDPKVRGTYELAPSVKAREPAGLIADPTS